MGRIEAFETSIIVLNKHGGFFSRVRQSLKESRQLPKPDFVIGAGHGTHLPLLAVAREHGACSVVLMKPGLPLSWFDWCIAPEHDFDKRPDRRGLILSKGALNRVVPSEGERSGNLILVGGPSKSHGYDEENLILQIEEIAKEGEWEIVDSRRTPDSFRTALGSDLPSLVLSRHEDTPSGWLADRLSKATEVWVTEDSVSMVYEALTGGARVGIVDVPRLKSESRVVRGLELLKSQGYFLNGDSTDVSKPRLAEADRCARCILA